MTFDPSAVRSGAIASTNPVYQAAWICYVNGVEVPIMGFQIDCGVWKIPSFSIDMVPDILLQRLGNEDRVPVQIFYLDYWCNPANPEFRLLIDGEIIGWRYSSSAGQRTMSFSCLSHIHVFQQLYFFYMTNIDDIVAASGPDVQSSAFTQAGLLYPYSLFHQGLIVTPTQVADARPAPRRRAGQPRRPVAEVSEADLDRDDRVRQPIKAPFELIYNVVKGVIGSTVPAKRRAIPMMNFFARHMRKTRFHNRFVRLPYLEDPEELADKKGCFPIFQAARNTEAISAMQRQSASQIGNSGPVWNTLEQIYSMVYMEIAMIPNPAAVVVALGTTSITAAGASAATAEPQDGKILGLLSSQTPIVDRKTEAQLENEEAIEARANSLAAQIRAYLNNSASLDPAVLSQAGLTSLPASAIEVDETQIRTHLQRQSGLRASGEPVQAGLYPTNEGTNPLTPIRLAQYFIKPQMFFGIPPHCNIIFPSMVDAWTYDEPFLTQPTRIYVNDSVMSNLLGATGANRDFMLHALTVAFPEEASAVMEHKHPPETGQAAANAESGKNLLIWPEEFYKGPVTAKLALPAWFQMLRQFSNGTQADGAPAVTGGATSTSTGAVVVGGDAANGPKAVSLFGARIPTPSSGTAFGIRDGKFHAGADFFAPVGTDIYAVFEGVISVLKQNFEMAECGTTLIVKHINKGPLGENIWCSYMHLSAVAEGLRAGSRVRPGQVIGKVGHRNGTRQFQRGGPFGRNAQGRNIVLPSTVAIFGIPDEVVTQAENAATRDECDTLLQPYVAGKTPPEGSDLTIWPWKNYLHDGWQAVARGVGGFMRTDAPHCHFEVIVDRAGVTSPLSAPKLRNGLPVPDNRIDPVAWLRAIGVSLGTNHSAPATIARRGRVNAVATNPVYRETGPASDDRPPSLDLGSYTSEPIYSPSPTGAPLRSSASTAPTTNAQVPPVAVAHPGSGTPPTSPPPVATHTTATATRTIRVRSGWRRHLHVGRGTAVRVPVSPSAAPAAGAPSGTPHVATGTPPAAASTTGTQEREKTFQDLFKLYAQSEYLKQRYTVRQAAVQMRFNPYLVPGFPSMMFDSMRTRFHIVGYMQNISHSASAGNGGSISTQAQLSCCRTLPEFINDVLSDSVRFTARVMAAPAETIETIRTRIQDEAKAEEFYRRLFYGDGPRPSGAPCAFRWDEAMSYSRGVEVDGIVNEGLGVAAAAAEDDSPEIEPTTTRATTPTTTTVTTSTTPVNATPSVTTATTTAAGTTTTTTPGVVTDHSTAAAPPPTVRGARRLSTNLNPNLELSPSETIYQDAFDRYDVAMQLASRPACSLEQYIRFWHAGMTVNDLLTNPDPTNNLLRVEGPQDVFSYAQEPTVDVVAERANAAGTRENIRGNTTRVSATYFDRIFRLRPGPGEDLEDGVPGNHLKPPSDEQQGYTSPTETSNVIQPTTEHDGVPSLYPQTRTDWDAVLEQYRKKVRTILRPST